MVQSPFIQLAAWADKYPRYLEAGVVLLLFLIGFLWLGARPLEPWDESRFGENALWQLRTGDVVNAYYPGEPDTWNVKPPLARWMICVGYLLFGENTFGLRFFSALAVVLASWLFYRWIREEVGNGIAVPAIFVIISCRAWFGYHVGQTGDADAFLLLGLLISAIYGYRYFRDPSWKNGLILVLGIGIAFWSKSFLAYLFIPGMIIWAVLTPERRKIFFQPRTYVLAIGALGWPLLWYVLVSQFGLGFPENEFLGKNAWDTMIQYDFLARATEESLEGVAAGTGTHSTVLSSLDVRLGPWFYVAILGLILWTVNRKPKSPFWTFSGLLLVSSTFLFLLSSTYLNWYLVPALGFYALFSAYAMNQLAKKTMVFLWIIGALWLGLVSLKIYSSSPKTSNDQRIIQTILEEADPETSIQLIKYAPQDLQLMADWASSQVIRRFDPVNPEEIIHSGGIIIGYPDDQLVKNLIEHDYQQVPYRDGTEIWQKR